MRQTKNSKRLKAEWLWNWPETFVVDDGCQDFRSEKLLVDTIQVLEDEIHLVMSEHSIVQTEENLSFIMTETLKEHRSVTFASSIQISKDLSVQVELLQKSAEMSSVLQHVQQGKLFIVTMIYVGNPLLEEGNKCFELDKSYGFVHEQLFALQEDWSEEAMSPKICHVAMKLDKTVEGNAKNETQVMN